MWGKKDWNSKQPKRSPGMQSHGVMQLGGWPGCLLSPALPFGWHPSDLGREDRHLPTFCQGGGGASRAEGQKGVSDGGEQLLLGVLAGLRLRER